MRESENHKGPVRQEQGGNGKNCCGFSLPANLPAVFLIGLQESKLGETGVKEKKSEGPLLGETQQEWTNQKMYLREKSMWDHCTIIYLTASPLLCNEVYSCSFS